MSETAAIFNRSILKIKKSFHEYRYIIAAALVLLGLVIMLINMLTGLTPKMAKLMSSHKEAKIDMAALNKPVGDFGNIVAPYTPPIDETAPTPEFRPREWVVEHESEWTLQIMNVDSEKLIKEYLQKRKDRQQFYYFKIEQDDSLRFVLIYRLFLSKAEADIARQQVQFDLPDNVQAFVEAMSSYVEVLPVEAPKVKLSPKPAVNLHQQSLPVEALSEITSPTTIGTEKGEDTPVSASMGNISDNGMGQGVPPARDVAAATKEPTIKEALRKSFREKIGEKLKAPEEKTTLSEQKSEQADLPAVSDPF